MKEVLKESGCAGGGAAVENDLVEWRRNATHVLFVASAFTYAPCIIFYINQHALRFAWPLEISLALTYAAAAVGALFPRKDHRIKVLVLLIPAYAVAVLGAVGLPQGPFLRSAPLFLAVVVLVLIGPRAGRAATVAGVVITLFAPLLREVFPLWAAGLVISPRQTPLSPIMTLTQGVALTGFLVTVMFVLECYHQLLVQSIVAEQSTAAKLKQESTGHAAAHRSLQNEMEERRRLEREMGRISDEESRRLGQEVHDGVCQQLTGALLRCQTLERRLDSGRDVTLEDLNTLSSLLGEAIDEAHAVAKGLCPLEPSPGALSPALRTLAKRTQTATGVRCDFAVTGDVSVVDPAVAQHLYRIAQEAISNASRHAHASRIVVELKNCGDRLVLRVEDDGTGLPAELPSEGLGLRTMAYRAQILDGKITVGAGSNGGTSVVCSIPHADGSSPENKPDKSHGEI